MLFGTVAILVLALPHSAYLTACKELSSGRQEPLTLRDNNGYQYFSPKTYLGFVIEKAWY